MASVNPPVSETCKRKKDVITFAKSIKTPATGTLKLMRSAMSSSFGSARLTPNELNKMKSSAIPRRMRIKNILAKSRVAFHPSCTKYELVMGDGCNAQFVIIATLERIKAKKYKMEYNIPSTIQLIKP